MKVVTVVDNPNHPGLKRLTDSLNKFGYQYEVLIAPFQFGTQMNVLYKYCKEHPDEPFIYSDGFDTWALAPMLGDAVLPQCKILVSAETNCFPLVHIKEQYPITEHPWRFVNAGQFLVRDPKFFIWMYEISHRPHDNDQAWLSLQFLENNGDLKLDLECQLFQSCAFEQPDYFAYADGRLINRYTKTQPIFLHFNGHTDPRHVEKALSESCSI